MDLQTLWFILIAVLYTGYFVLEGFDLGVGILFPFLGKDNTRRRMMINAIGPHWDGNEVWLLTAGGATFAAFPQWYATLFSGFYLPLFLMLVALILRGVAFEFRGKLADLRWQKAWDWCIFLGSAIPGLLWGVAFSNFVRGVAVDANMNYYSGFFELLNPYALVGGVLSLCGFALHGALFLSIKTAAPLSEEARQIAWKAWIPTVAAVVIYMIFSYFETDVVKRLGVNPGVVPVFSLLTLLTAGWLIRIKREGWAFILMAVSILLAVATAFTILYPRVLVSSLNPAWSLTIYNTSSSPYTLQVMSIVALVFVPIVLAYTAWAYWVFRKRVTQKPEDLHY
jgi:cytochrome d ubiquinol oxidase subunit II